MKVACKKAVELQKIKTGQKSRDPALDLKQSPLEPPLLLCPHS